MVSARSRKCPAEPGSAFTTRAAHISQLLEAGYSLEVEYPGS